jgi:hypothetical protein
MRWRTSRRPLGARAAAAHARARGWTTCRWPRRPGPLPPLEGYTFQGYRNADGSVGTRNLLAITQTVQCVAGVVDFAVRRIRAELLPRTRTSTTWSALEHGYGCGVAIDAPDAEVPIRTLRHISLNPNFGGEVMVVSLGCEKLQPERLLPPGSIRDPRRARTAAEDAGLDVVCLQDDAHVGFMSMVEAHPAPGRVHLQRLNARRRETVPASELVVGVQCGGSDAFSGVTANPAVGFCTDLLVRAGATVMFSETTEVRDGIAQLTARAATPEVAEAMIERWPGTTPTCSAAASTAAPTPRRATRRAGCPTSSRRRWARSSRAAARRSSGCWRRARSCAQAARGPGLRRHAGQRLHLRHAAAGRRHEPARLHHRPRHPLRPGGGARW